MYTLMPGTRCQCVPGSECDGRFYRPCWPMLISHATGKIALPINTIEAVADITHASKDDVDAHHPTQRPDQE
jgi:hypothetical protein